MFVADAVKCFNKLWLKDCLLEMYNLGYDPNTLKTFYGFLVRSIETGLGR